MEQLLNRIMKASLPVRIGGIAGIIVLVTVLNLLAFINPVESQIANQQLEQRKLDSDLAEKNEIAQNLTSRRRELEELNQKFAEALTELPETADLDELLGQLNDVGKKAGLEIQHVQPGSESSAGFYAKIPVKMRVTGNYHEIAMFLQEVSNLRRIVNVSDISMTSPDANGSEKVILTADFMATTFRFLDKPLKQGDKKGAP